VALSLIDKTWEDLRTRVSAGIKENFPIEGRKNSLVLHDISFDEKGAVTADLKSQEEAKALGRTWGATVYGEVGLVDKETGKEIDRQKIKLFTLPKPTQRYSYIVNGTEKQVDNVWRLRSGVYAHIKQNGKMQAEFNLATPLAKSSRVYIPFDPEKKSFHLKFESSNYPLYSMLRNLGVSDEEMKKTWGDAIYKANLKNDKQVQQQASDLYDKMATRGVKAVSDKHDDKLAAIWSTFDAAKLLPETTKATLGKPITSVTGEALLLASKRILEVARGDIPQDNRDSLIFKQLHSLDDFLHEKLVKPQTKAAIRQKVSNNIDRQVKVRDIIAGEFFAKPIHEYFSKSQTARTPEQVNPLEMLSNHRVTTIIAPDEGGIKNEQTVTAEMQIIDPSHLGFLDPVHTPDGRTGITLHLPLGVRKEGNEVTTLVHDLQTGKQIRVTPAELHTGQIVLPDQVKWVKGKPTPIASAVKMQDPKTHEIVEKPFSQGRYVLMSANQLFDESTNLIPFLQNDQGNRTMVASKQLSQAIGLHYREQPQVQVKSGSGQSWERIVGTPWSHESPFDGHVAAIKKDPVNGYPSSLVLQSHDGKKHEIQVYNHFPLNDTKTCMHSDLNVKVGDAVKKGQVIADSNFTKDGVLSLGTNIRVAYMPYKGYNFEDGVVISESGAKKLTSEHVHRHSIEIDPEKDFLDKKKFVAFASTTASQLTKEQMNKLGDDGVIQVGQKVMPGDVLLAAIGKRDLTGESARAVSRLDKKLFAIRDKSVVWDNQHEGEVVKVTKNPNGKEVTVHVKTLEPTEIGDKIVGRHGNKGIITKIIPDHEMPRIGGPDGEHVQMLLNPSGVSSRINLGQLLETAAAKIAQKTGKPYLIQNFSGDGTDYTQKIKDELKAHNISDTETLFDGATGKKLGEIFQGNQYILKLKHQVEKKMSVRSNGPNYSLDRSPKGTGAEHPGQAMGQLELYAMLAHGARANLREMATYKAEQHTGDRNNPAEHIDFWQRVQTGQPLPPPQIPFAYKKFEAMLTGLGVNVKKEGNSLVLQPLTDSGILSMSNGQLLDAGRVLRGKDAKELERGLFDPKITGGLPNDVGKGLKWSHISLPEPVPNPVFVGTNKHPGPAVVLTGLKFDEFEEIARGHTSIDGKTGGAAINSLLAKINVKEELVKVKASLGSLRGSQLDKANRKTKFLQALDGIGMKPTEAYMLNHIPVLPPVYRPIVPMPDGALRPDDINYYYKSLGHVIKQYKEAPKELGDEGLKDLREDLYEYTRGLAGLPGGKPLYESNRKMKGILDTISGTSPKEGYFQKKLMKRRQELSMRSTIIPEPSMDLDHVGIPKDSAMELYKPFVVREMQFSGYDPIQALKEIKQGSKIAWHSLQAAMDKRPILLKRDPVLHKFGVMAFKPKLVEGRAIKIHPLVCTGYNADFDGDAMSAFVPLGDDAVKEAHKMFPSNNLFSSTTGGIMYAPDHESMLGLHMLSKWGKETGKSFHTLAEAKKAQAQSALHVNDVVSIASKKTTLGRELISEHLPESIRHDPAIIGLFQDPNFVFVKRTDKKDEKRFGVHNLLGRIAKEDPKNFPVTVDNLKNLGNQYSYELGSTLNLSDLTVHKEIRDAILRKADAEVAKIHSDSKLAPEQKKERVIGIYTQATSDMVRDTRPLFEKSQNNAYMMVNSGARSSMDQFRQMTIAPMLMQDALGNVLTTPVKKSYSEGLDTGDYWTAMHGARKGTIQKVEGTSEPGRLTKEIVNVVIPNMIESKDCGTTQGIMLHTSEDDVADRYLAAPVKLPGGQSIAAGSLIDGNLLATLKKHNIDKVVVRSPLKCAHHQGICAKCYGLNESGNTHEVGANIGVIAGHAMGEPATQLAMDSFHTGGVASSKGGGSLTKFDRLNQLLEMPKVLRNAAVLSRASGPIQKIEKDIATNGWNIFVGGEKHFISAQREPMYEGQPLKTGMDVKKGEALSDGLINPRDLLKYTDIHQVQNFLTDQLHTSVYKDARVKRRNIETVVRALTNITQVKDPGDSEHLHGDFAQRSVVEDFNKNLKSGGKPILHEPILRGAEQMARDQHEDWLARLNFQELRHTLLEGTAKGWKTDLHGSNPIPAYARGSEFGLGTKERPHYY
jgi:DNA-directed RNA polymerase subunit beta'